MILADEPAVAAVDMRGGAPGTCETDALDPLGLVGRADAVVLAGGSVYGLRPPRASPPGGRGMRW